MSILSEHGFRQDGRSPYQIRNISCTLGVHTQADGSAYIEQGNTKVLCAVYGPHEPRQRSRVLDDRCFINCQFSRATFATVERKDRPHGDRRSTQLARLMEKAFETAIITQSYPRAQIDIFCEILEDDGSTLAVAVNAASLALTNAGIPMRDLVVALSCACSNGVPCVDLCSREENSITPRITLATLSGKDEIIFTDLHNCLHQKHLAGVLEGAKKGAEKIQSCLGLAVSKSIASKFNGEIDEDFCISGVILNLNDSFEY